ncbi:MAG: response regulator, partial [Gammaproteobacteria bacterium]
NVEALQALSDYLELNGFRVAQAIDGEAVLHALEDDWPDVLVLDIGLPGRDGLEIAREVRARYAERHCVLIAVTGYGSRQMAEKTRAAGFDHHFVKPISLEQLRACLQ